MSDQSKPATGGCMCGAVRYEVIGEPLEVGHCHCHSCRRHTGAPVVTFVVFEVDKVRFSGHERSIYKSSPGVKRAFCGQCGTSLTWEGVYGEHVIIEFHISTLDDPNAYVPTLHWFHNDRIEWFDVADNLPRYWEDDEGERLYRHGPATEGPQAET
jgi:hypothetical protein